MTWAVVPVPGQADDDLTAAAQTEAAPPATGTRSPPQASEASTSPRRRGPNHGASDWRASWRKPVLRGATPDGNEDRLDMLGGWRGADGYGNEEGKDLVGTLQGLKARRNLR